MKKNYLLPIAIIATSVSLCASFASAQPLTELTNKRLYEHHSSAINNGANFGYSANGSTSGYNFVANNYYNSFDPNTCCPSNPYSNGEEANIDMVEHNGPFGNGGGFGFTAATSTIWGGVIFGNSSTRWMPAPTGFNYATITNVSDIANAFNTTTATYAISAVQENAIYLGKIRGSNRYVAMKCYNVTNVTGPVSGQANVFFEFDYKWGILASTGIDEPSASKIAVYPNPAASDHITVEHLAANTLESAVIYSAAGKLVQSFSLNNQKETLDISLLTSGVYFLLVESENEESVMHKLIKE